MLHLRDFLAAHSAEHLHVRKRVELDQVGALTAQAHDTIVFEDIGGYGGWQIVDLLFCHRAAQARVLDCEPEDVLDALLEVLRRGPRPLREVADGPCQEIVQEGEEVDLGTLPIVTHTDRDPYPYTTCFAVHRDPDGGFNSMNPRCGVLAKREMVASFVTPTANRILAAHRADGTKMPQAIAIGVHPAWELASVYSHPHKGWWELELFESITGHPGEVVPCRSVDLVVPADACAVIEGYVNPQRSATDGPSPGPTMLFTPYAAEQPVFEVTAITRRREPIYRNHLMTPITDHQGMPRMFHEALIRERLMAMGLEVRDVRFPPAGGALICVIQVVARFEGEVTDALLQVMGSSFINTKMAIVVDPDIDVGSEADILYALATRVDPARDVIIVPGARGWPFDPSAQPLLGALPTTEQSRFPAIVGKWGIDATKPPVYRPNRGDFERAWPKDWGQVRLKDFLDSADSPPFDPGADA
jgi:2,5-furandicarboxylate decarboxylase 1